MKLIYDYSFKKLFSTCCSKIWKIIFATIIVLYSCLRFLTQNQFSEAVVLWDITSLPLLYFETSYLKTKNIFFCFFSHCSFQYTSVLLLEPISHNMINLLKRNTSETIIACQIVFHCYHANSL